MICRSKRCLTFWIGLISWQRTTTAERQRRCFVRRRSFLKGTGIVTVAVVGGGVWRAWDQGVFTVGEGPAYEPWKDWRNTANDVSLALVRAAILPASPHHPQPSLSKIPTPSSNPTTPPQPTSDHR